MHRIRSGAKAHVSYRDGSKDSPILPLAQPARKEPKDTSVLTRPPPLPISPQDNAVDPEKTDNVSPQSKSQPDAARPPDNAKTGGEESAAVATKTPPDKLPLGQRMKKSFVNFWLHTKGALLSSWINVLLIFVPIGIAVELAHLSPGIIFAMNAIAVIPLAGLLAHATESVAHQLGDALGALLNVSFGNAVELIILIALVKNEIRIVQASLIGSILANLLLILGMAFLLGGLRFREQIYNNTVTQMSACLLSLSVMSLLLPTAFHASFSDGNKADAATLRISRGTSVVLLLVYFLYLLFQLKSHAYLYESIPQERIDEESHPGLLHDMLDTSSSSSSSSSSSDSDSDSSSNSHTTAKRIKRAFRRRRRKSTTASEDAQSIPSHVSSPGTEESHIEKQPATPGERKRRGSILEAIFSGDEADREDDRDQRAAPRVRDFENNHAESSTTPRSAGSPDGRRKKHKRRKNKKKKSKQHEKRHDVHDEIADQVPEMLASQASAEARHSNSGARGRPNQSQHHVGFVEDVQVAPENAAARLPFRRPGLPKLLSENLTVFVQPPPVELLPANRRMRSSPRLRRTSSLPDRLRQQSPEIAATRVHSHNIVAGAGAPGAADAVNEVEAPHEGLPMSRTAAIVMLLLTTGLVAVCAEFLLDAIPEMVEDSHISQAFIGLIILPVVGNAAEHVTAVKVATKNKMDLSIGVAVGSSIQIAIFITPIVVVLGWCMSRDMSLYFNLFETVSLFVTVFVVNFLVLDGKSNYLEGTLLVASYVIISLVAFYYPDPKEQSLLGGAEGVASTTTHPDGADPSSSTTAALAAATAAAAERLLMF